MYLLVAAVFLVVVVGGGDDVVSVVVAAVFLFVFWGGATLVKLSLNIFDKTVISHKKITKTFIMKTEYLYTHFICNRQQGKPY